MNEAIVVYQPAHQKFKMFSYKDSKLKSNLIYKSHSCVILAESSLFSLLWGLKNVHICGRTRLDSSSKIHTQELQ